MEELFDPTVYAIKYNVKRDAGLLKTELNGRRKSYHELDIFIPDLKLGFEYQVCV